MFVKYLSRFKLCFFSKISLIKLYELRFMSHQRSSFFLTITPHWKEGRAFT